MRAFKIINSKESEQLKKQFPQLLDRECDLEDFKYNSRVCVFDHVLDVDEAKLLLDNISIDERKKRDLKWSALYQILSEQFVIYMIKYRKNELLFKAPRSSSLLINRLEKMDSAGTIDFVIPALGIWYQQYWDDTHLVCYQDPKSIATFLNAVKNSGLFWLE